MSPSKGQPLNCSICGAMYTVTTRTIRQREDAYHVHTGSERHRREVARLVAEDQAQEHAARDRVNA